MSYKGQNPGNRNGQHINVSQELLRETWKHTWCNTNFWTADLNRASVDGQRKDERSHPSVMSPGRYGMSRRAAKVKPGPEPPPQDPGGRFQGTSVRGP